VAIIDQGQIIALDTPKALINSLGGGIIHLGVPPEMPGSLIAEVERLPDVQGVAHTDGKLEITAQHAQHTLIGVIKIFNEADVSITSLEILEPNLETVFLHLTGKRLRN
jgi:ABC-2 type transport system ATP-binding protein